MIVLWMLNIITDIISFGPVKQWHVIWHVHFPHHFISIENITPVVNTCYIMFFHELSNVNHFNFIHYYIIQ